MTSLQVCYFRRCWIILINLLIICLIAAFVTILELWQLPHRVSLKKGTNDDAIFTVASAYAAISPAAPLAWEEQSSLSADCIKSVRLICHWANEIHRSMPYKNYIGHISYRCGTLNIDSNAENQHKEIFCDNERTLLR